MPIQDQTTNWPFFAVDIFTEMGVPAPIDEDLNNDELNMGFAENNKSIDDKLATLINLGFVDEDKNREILSRFNNDVERTVNYFLDNESVADVVAENNQPSTSAAINLNESLENSMPSTSKEPSIVTISLVDDDSDFSDNEIIASNDSNPPCKIESNDMELPDDVAALALDYDAENFQAEMEDCPICCNDFESYETSPSPWQLLQCSHKVCLACYAKLLTSRYTMSGVQHTFVKCQFCQGTSGIEVGTCPDMQMNVSIHKSSCDGFGPSTTIAINYSGYNFNRTAYLPNNADGQEALRLLKIAFDRRLCFTVGTSNTTMQENVVVWNIHHKTSLYGGVSSHGYPDPEYLNRVKWELKDFGIQ